MKKILFTLLIALLCLTAVLCFTSCGGGSNNDNDDDNGNNSIIVNGSKGLIFVLNDDESSYAVIGIGTCTDTKIVIPAEYNNLPVTAIGDSAFFGCDSFTSITIPDSVTAIGNEAFYSCDKLTSITIPNGVTSIGDKAFCLCDGLTSITIPNSVTAIGDSAFYSCDKLTSVTIPNSVTSIGGDAFSGCHKLVEVYNLSSLNITKNTSSNGYAGYYAKAIHTSLNENSILENVDDYIFMTWEDNYYLMGYVGNDTVLTLPENYKGNNYSIYSYAFCYNGSITKITIPNGVTSIGEEAFCGCDGLTSVTIGNSVTSIGNEAFYSCDGLTSITILNGVASIGKSAFYGCGKLVEVYNLSSLDVAPSFNAEKVIHTSLNEDSILENVDDYIFMTWEDNYYLMGYVGNDTVLTLPKNYKGNNYSIYDYAFVSNNSITKITIPDSVTYIGDYAFSDCSGLTSVTIPDSITSIGKRTFFRCKGLRSVTFENTEGCM